MNAVYVVVENGQPYKVAYASFASAAAAVKEKHKYEVEAQLLELGGGPICSDIDVPEDKVTGKTLEHGVSVTDACISTAQTAPVLQSLAMAVRKRRAVARSGT